MDAVNHGTLEQSMDAMVSLCGLTVDSELGAKVKLALCELYEVTPPGFQEHITVTVRHAPVCPVIWVPGATCLCSRSVEIGFPGMKEPVIVH